MEKELKRFKIINNWETQDIDGNPIEFKKNDIITFDELTTDLPIKTFTLPNGNIFCEQIL